jgi:hypothetical protein
VQSFSFEVSVTDSDITLTGAGFSTGAFTYIFAGNSFDEANSFTLNTLEPGLAMDGSDGTNNGLGVTLTSGQSLALGEVLFDISPTAATGLFSVSFAGGAASNNMSDATGTLIPVNNFSGGTIDIQVPEPGTPAGTVLGFGAILLGAIRKRRRQALARSS